MSLKSFFEPNSIAIIGASPNPDKLSHAVLKNLVDSGYGQEGKIFPVHPNAAEILGYPAYPTVTDVPDTVDLAVIVVPFPHVPAVLQACGQKKVPAAVIITAGFREAGPNGRLREEALMEIANSYNIRIIGPNCLGILDTHTPMNATFAPGVLRSGPAAFMSQSGALGVAILDWAQAGRLGLSKFVSLGNKADVDEVDLLREWHHDEQTRVILIYSEALSKGQEFIRVARQVSQTKPILAIKSGNTQSGSRAVSSHTGSLAGSQQAYEAAFKQAGVLQTDSLESLFDMALAFGYQPPLKGERIAIVTNAGGPGILATDAIERAGLTIAPFSDETIEKLRKLLPEAAVSENPVDILGDASPERYRLVLETVAADPNVDGVLAMLVPQAVLDTKAVAKAVVAQEKHLAEPLLTCFMGESRMRDALDILNEHRIPNYQFPERAAQVFRAMANYQKYYDRPPAQFNTYSVDHAAVREVIDQVRAAGRSTMGDLEASRIMTAYGLPMPKFKLAKTAEQAVEIADQIGYPVALKVASPDILHKTDVGGVRIRLQNAAEVQEAFLGITDQATNARPTANLWGCLVQEMVPPLGVEILIGMKRDPQFGPLVAFGIGGIFVETLRDVTFRVAPFSEEDAAEMIDDIRARALLDGVRGRPPADKAAVVDVLLRIGQLALDFPEINELDINPLVVYGEGVLAVDMRLALTN
ncbi:MAG: acetate--CoA ligase family protein [Ardenticatenaceae bacterium]|nr:acetate--CoA ligase family protein [Ardenticatenaceae bacterium]